ncbi:MAG: SDR family NAD(P)-dependent oxidoreductase [Candidatus Acidiferrales bacterium]|jgi:NAD(P)-dependent dehydrogenase (short-subunit alcohol dehydrogenase family)
MLLKEQVAIVTGGGRGIGRAIARKFAEQGAAVVVTARTDSEILGVTAEIQNSGGKAAAIQADVSREAECEKIVRETHRIFGAVHILVNNAGVLGPVQPIERVEPREWDRVIAVNLRGPYLLSRLVLPGMYQRGAGSILNIVSVAAKSAFQLNGPYATSKAGLIGLTHTLAAESARKGVRVNALSPGPVSDTMMYQELGRNLAQYLRSTTGEVSARMLGGILQGRPQTAEEIASAALFLVSDQSTAITGQTLNVDGGMVFY